MPTTDLKPLWRAVHAQFRLGRDSVHGPDHWRRVEANGLMLAAESGADVLVVRLFAVLHDSCREDEGFDRGHGRRGARLAERLRGELFEVDDGQMERLVYACTWHTTARTSDDVTIGTCWDSDRLDLPRVGVWPRAEFLSTAAAKAGAGRPNR